MKRVLPLVVLLAGCPTDPAGPANETPVGDMFCGTIDGEVGNQYWGSAHPTGCFLLRFEDENDRGTFVDDTFTGATRVHWYMPLPLVGDAGSTSGGGDCLASGVDADGATDGWSVTMDDGHCNMPAFDVSGQANTARMHTLATSTLTRTADGVWQRRGHMWSYDYYYTDADPLETTGNFHFPLGMQMDGAAEAATVGWPIERFGGSCEVDGCWSASDWSGEIVVGASLPNCTDELAGFLPGIGEQLYDVAADGHRGWWPGENLWRPFVKVPNQCVYARSYDNAWTTALDHDALRIAATWVGDVYRANASPQWQYCEFRFTAPLVQSTDCAGEPHPG